MKRIFIYMLFFVAFWPDESSLAKSQYTSKLASDHPEIVLGLRDYDDNWGSFHRAIYTEVFKRLGLAVRFEEYPLKRLSDLVDNTDVLDGDISRVKDYDLAHPRLIRVEEPHSYSAIEAYSIYPTLELNGWDSLNGSSLTIDYRHGAKKAFEELKKRIPEENLGYVHSIESGLMRLIECRSDIFVSSGVYLFLENGAFRGQRIYRAGVMEHTSFHLFLLKKHKGLAIKISEELKQMKTEGRIKSYRQEFGLSPI